MPYPPDVPEGTRINTTPQASQHPADHNEIHAALLDIINELGSNPSGTAADLTTYLAQLNPIGEMRLFAGAVAPTGWHLCDGTAISRTAYPELFALFGTTYGTGNGSTTFNLPDTRGRFVAGRNPAGPSWCDSLNDSGGTADAAVIAHSHVASSGNQSNDHVHGPGSYQTNITGHHDHNLGDGSPLWWSTSPGIVSPVAGVGMQVAYWDAQGDHYHVVNAGVSGGVSAGHSHVITVNPEGESGINKNLPPHLVVNYIIRLG